LTTVGAVGGSAFEARIRELVEGRPELQNIMVPLLAARRALRDRFADLHRRLLAVVKEDKVCRRLMTIPGVGPVVSLAFTATIDIPARFRNARSVGPVSSDTYFYELRRHPVLRGVAQR